MAGTDKGREQRSFVFTPKCRRGRVRLSKMGKKLGINLSREDERGVVRLALGNIVQTWPFFLSFFRACIIIAYILVGYGLC